LKKER